MAGITDRIADSVPGWGAKLSYGAKQTVGGTEIVPVAFVGFGFGAGEGQAELDPPAEGGESREAHGEGGGGGGVSIPLGAYIADADGLRFRANPVVLLSLGVSLVGAIGASISAIVWAARRKR